MSYPSPYDQHGQPPDPYGPPAQQQPGRPAEYGSPQQAYPVQPVQPTTPTPYGYQQPQPAHVPPTQTQTVATGGLSTGMHLAYLFLGWIPCFLGWVIWPIHWWFAKSKSVATTQTSGVMYQPPPQQWNPPGPR